MAWGAALHALVRYARTVEAKQLRQARLVLLLSAAFSPLYPRCYAWRDSIVPAPGTDCGWWSAPRGAADITVRQIGSGGRDGAAPSGGQDHPGTP